MKNRYFSPSELSVLFNSASWRLISTRTPLRARLARNTRAGAWARRVHESHPHQEVMMSLRGDAFFSIQGTPVSFCPGDIAFIDSNEEHGYPYPQFYPDVVHLLVQITEKAILFRNYGCRAGRELPQRPTVPLHGGSVGMSLLKECLTRSRQYPDLPSEFVSHQLLTALRLIISEIVMQGYLPDADESLSKKGRQQRMVTTVQEHISDTTGRGISIKGLSKLTGYSEHHLVRLFRAFTGQTIHDYVETVRMLKMKELLEQGRSKKGICTELGFSCPPAFSRWLASHDPSLLAHTRRASAQPRGR